MLPRGIANRRRQQRSAVLLVRQLTGPGGVNRSVTNLANGLVETGLDVTVMTLLRPARIRYQLDPRVRVTWVRDKKRQAQRRTTNPRRRALDSQPSRLCESDEDMTRLTDVLLRRRLASLDPCTVISHRPALHEAAALWTPADVNCLAVEHTEFERRPPEVRNAIRDIVPRLDRMVLLTETNAQQWRRFVGPGPGLSVIPNGVRVQAGESVTSWSAPVVIAAGNLLPRKGFDRLIRAYAPLAAEFPHWQLRIFGKGSEEQGLAQTIDELGLEGTVKLEGYSSRLNAEMLSASVYAMSSHSEALPMVLLEAMGAGLPVVAFDCTGPHEVVAHGRTGLLVEDGDIEGMTAALRTLMADEDIRRRYGTAARQDATRYSIENVVDQWRTLIREVSRRQSRGHRMRGQTTYAGS